MCGEKDFRTISQIYCIGSPPRMRGKDHPPAYFSIFRGITPAYAGKSPPQARMPGLCRDHPRVCGEKLNTHLTFPPSSGSPPRMRGKVMLTRWPFSMSGITPAYAGKSPARPGPRPWRWDHPRVCGEKFLEVVQPIAQWGSPPRMRGKAYQRSCAPHMDGITPAYAGKRHRAK